MEDASTVKIEQMEFFVFEMGQKRLSPQMKSSPMLKGLH
jgi:hypothetical protein